MPERSIRKGCAIGSESVPLVKVLSPLPVLRSKGFQVLSVPKVITAVQNYVRCSLCQQLKGSTGRFLHDHGHGVREGNLDFRGDLEGPGEADVSTNDFRLLKEGKQVNQLILQISYIHPLTKCR